MFTRLKSINGAYSPEGFSVEVTGTLFAPYIEYKESDGHLLKYPFEVLAPGATYDIDVALIGLWEAPHADEAMELRKKQQVAERIVAAMVFLGWPIRLIHTRIGHL